MTPYNEAMKQINELKKSLQNLQEKKTSKSLSALLKEHETLLSSCQEIEKSYLLLQEKYSPSRVS